MSQRASIPDLLAAHNTGKARAEIDLAALPFDSQNMAAASLILNNVCPGLHPKVGQALP